MQALYNFIVKKGDNFTKLLTNAGVSFQELQNIIIAISTVVDLKKLLSTPIAFISSSIVPL